MVLEIITDGLGLVDFGLFSHIGLLLVEGDVIDVVLPILRGSVKGWLDIVRAELVLRNSSFVENFNDQDSHSSPQIRPVFLYKRDFETGQKQ